jgi:hypothetical protein
MDIVIPLGTGSTWHDNELRYCLRSIEKNLTGYRDIYIVGAKRKWLQEVKYIDAKEDYTRKERCIFQKIILACEHPEVSDSFLFTNDDIFILQPTDASLVKYWMNRDLRYLMVISDGTYRNTVSNTFHFLNKGSHPLANYDIHVPIVYDKNRFLDLLAVDWRRDHVIKSLYCNLNKVTGEPMRDLKFVKTMRKEDIYKAIEGRQFFSVNDHCLNQAMFDVLAELYPKPSKYEKQ